MSARRAHGSGSVYQRSDGKWVGTMEAGWTERGTRRRVTVLAKTEAEAKRRLRDRQRAALAGQQVTGRAVTVKAWADDWLAQYATHARPTTYATDSSIVRRWIIPNLGNRRLTDLGAADVRRMMDAMRAVGRSSTTIGYAQAVLARMLRAARAEGHTIPDAALEVRRPADAVSDRQALPMTDAVAVLEAASRRPDGSRWVAALLQGMRQGECLGLTWEHVDADAARVDVSWQLQRLPYLDRDRDTFRLPDGYEARRLEGAWHLTRPKTARGQRRIPMLPWMAEPIAAWRQVAPTSPHGLVWPRANGMPRDSKADRAEWWELQEEAGVAHPSGRPYLLHEARHTTATLLLAARVDPAVITEILGHSSIVVSRGYQTVDEGMLRDALSRVHGLLSSG